MLATIARRRAFPRLARSRHAVRSRDSPGHGSARGRVRGRVPNGLDASARRDRRRSPALLREAHPRDRSRLQHDHAHRGHRRRRVGATGDPAAHRRSPQVGREDRHDAPRRHEQGPDAGRVVTAAGGRLRQRPERRRRARPHAVHGRHRVAARGQDGGRTSRRPATTTRRASPRVATVAAPCSSSQAVSSPRRGARAPAAARSSSGSG